MYDSVTQHYNLYYKCDVNGKEEAGEYVNALFEDVVRNDKEAQGKVLKVFMGNTYFWIYGKLAEVGRATIDNVDDVIQEIQVAINKLFFKGIPEHVTANQFYGYLIGIARNIIGEHNMKDKKVNDHEQYVAENVSEEYFFNQNGAATKSPEEMLMVLERKKTCNSVINEYMNALSESKMAPHQLITYCYSILLPQIFKQSTKPEVVKKGEEISSRKDGKCNSPYDYANNKFTGKLGRNSVKLVEWALDAMFDMTISNLDVEFRKVIDIQDVIDYVFSWGTKFTENMEKDNKKASVKEKDVVITSVYQKKDMENWTARVSDALLKDVENILLSDKEFKKRSVKVVEDLIR